MFASHRLCALVAIALLQFSLPRPASAFIPWSNTNGDATTFTWSGGGSDNGLYGDPLLVGGDSLVFTPGGYRAESLNGVADAKADRLQVDLHAKPGFAFLGIELFEGGDYGILGQGSVSASGTLFVNDLDLPRNLHDDIITSPLSPILSGSGAWTGSANVPIPSVPGDLWTNVRIVLDNNLLAISTPGGVSFIEKKFAGLSVRVLIPEPSSVALLSLGGLALLRRRRRAL